MAALLGLGARRIFSNSFRLSLRPFSVGWMRNVFTPSGTLELNRFLPNTLGLRQLTDNVSTSESDAVFENDTAEQPDHSLISRRPPRRRQEEPKSFSRFSYERTMRKLGSVSSKETLRKHFEHMLREGMSELTCHMELQETHTLCVFYQLLVVSRRRAISKCMGGNQL